MWGSVSRGKWLGIRSARVLWNVLSKRAIKQNKKSKCWADIQMSRGLLGFDFGQTNGCFRECFHSRLDWGGCEPKGTPSLPVLPIGGVVKRCIEERLPHLLGRHRGAGPGRYWEGLCGYSNQRQRCQPGLIHLWCSLMRKLVSLNRPLFPLSGAHW